MNSQRVLPVVGSRRITSQVSVRRLGIAAWGAGSMASLLVAIFLFSRRAVGALAAIHWETVVAVCLITVMTTALGRAVWRRYSPFGGSRRAMCMAWSTATLTTVVAVMLVASPPRTLPEGLLLLAVAGVEIFFWWQFQFLPTRQLTVQGPSSPASAENLTPESDDLALPARAYQQITRERDEVGAERIVICARVVFGPNERQQNAHFAFCPPLGQRPHLSVTQADGPAAQVRVADVQAYGARVEVRLSQASSKTQSVTIAAFGSQEDRSGLP